MINHNEKEIIILTQLSTIIHNCSQRTDNYTDTILDSLCEIVRIHNKYNTPEIRVTDFRKKRDIVKVISAKDARDMSTKLYRDVIDTEFAEIMKAIDNSTKTTTMCSIGIRGDIRTEHKERLIQLGYNLKTVTVNNTILTNIQW